MYLIYVYYQTNVGQKNMRYSVMQTDGNTFPEAVTSELMILILILILILKTPSCPYSCLCS